MLLGLLDNEDSFEHGGIGHKVNPAGWKTVLLKDVGDDVHGVASAEVSGLIPGHRLEDETVQIVEIAPRQAEILALERGYLLGGVEPAAETLAMARLALGGIDRLPARSLGRSVNTVPHRSVGRQHGRRYESGEREKEDGLQISGRS